MTINVPFKLSDNFIESYKHKKPPFGFNGLGELVYMRTYSRIKSDGLNEKWWETIQRVVNGTYNMQKKHIDRYCLGWNAWQAQKSAQEMYDRMFNMKFLPPGRGLWAMGSTLTEEKNLYISLNNCSFVSTENIKDELSKPFCFLCDMSMIGIGTGFDLKGAGTLIIKSPDYKRKAEIFEIPDSREGWVESLRLLLESYFIGTHPIEFDYKLIRKEGELIKGFGGVSGGPKPLIEMHEKIKEVLNKEIGQPISGRTIADIMNLIARCIVSGNLRRSASIIFGSPFDDEYLDLKDYEKNKYRKEFGWASNNSVFAELGMNYKNTCDRVRNNGEPGFIWMENIKKYGRMFDMPDNKDIKVAGLNPCGEMCISSYGVCNLVEVFPNNNIDIEDFKRSLKFAYLYAKTVTLGNSHWPETNKVMLKERRIGCSLGGLAQFISKKGLNELKSWMEEGYKTIKHWDNIYSEWLAIPKSIRVSTEKPSGTLSLLVGATPGLHFPESKYYIRRVRLAKNSELIEPLKKAGYEMEPDINAPENTLIVSFPIFVGENIKTIKDVSIWEQTSLAAFVQKYWSDNAVSCTVTFKPEEENQLEPLLNYFQYQLKGISFLPKKETPVYLQSPYEEILEEKYKEIIKNIKKVIFGKVHNEMADTEKYCSSDKCELNWNNEKK